MTQHQQHNTTAINDGRKPQIRTRADRISSFKDSIWTEMTPLAVENDAINLGQGFPTWEVEPFVREALREQANSASALQYTRSAGDMQLVNKIAEVYSPIFYRDIDPQREVLVTNGASGGLHTVFQALINPGDEVIVMEPYFDTYVTNITSAGAKPVFISLHEPDPVVQDDNTIYEGRFDSNNWVIREDELRAAVTPKTRAILLNNPHNPTGKVFSRAELEMLSRVAIEHDLLVITDVVYEFLVYDRQCVIDRIASLPGMFERTISVCSAGKTFSITGLKVGWLIGPEELIHSCYLYNQYSVFCVNTASQRAVAKCFERVDYFAGILDRFEKHSGMLQEMLEGAGLKVVKPHSGYFMLADISNVDFPYDPNSSDPYDLQFCRWLPKEIKVAAIPPTSFVSTDAAREKMQKYARFCFCKTEEAILEAGQRLKKLPIKDTPKE